MRSNAISYLYRMHHSSSCARRHRRDEWSEDRCGMFGEHVREGALVGRHERCEGEGAGPRKAVGCGYWEGKRAPGLVLRGHVGRRDGAPGGPGTTEGDDAGLGDTGDEAQASRGSSCLTSELGIETGGCATLSSINAATYGVKDGLGPNYSHRSPGWMQQYGDDHLAQRYTDEEHSEGVALAPNYGGTIPLSQKSNHTIALDAHYPYTIHNHEAREQIGSLHPDATRPTYADLSFDGLPYTPPPQPPHFSTQSVQFETPAYGVHDSHSNETSLHITGYEHQVQQAEELFSSLETQCRTQVEHELQQLQAHSPASHQHVHIHIHHHHHHYHHHHTSAPLASLSLPDNTLSHAAPLYDSHIIPPTDLNLPFLRDPIACTDLAACFADTIQMSQEPSFVQSMEDPYAGVTMDWFAGVGNGFSTMTTETHEGLDGSGVGIGMGVEAPWNSGALDTFVQDAVSGSYPTCKYT